VAEIFQVHKNQVNFSFSNKRPRYISRNSNTNSRLNLALSYMWPWRGREGERERDIKELLGTQNPKTTLLLRHAISIL